MKKIMLTSMVFCFGLFLNNSFAQCSDAGVCSIGSHSIEENTAPFNLSFGYSYGYSGKDDDISYSSIKLSGTYQFFDQASFNFALPFNMQSGPWGDIHGIGDLLLSFSYGLILDESTLTVSLGVLLSTSDENKEYVPQQYRSGLKTNDGLLGLDYTISGFSIGAGYQLVGKPAGYDYLSVERGDDLLLRAGYLFKVYDFTVNPQLLFIKKLSKSKMYFLSNVLDANTIPEYLEVPESDQSQLNLLVNATYSVNDSYSHFIEVAVPFFKRDVNVDGLKRTFTISTGLSFSF